MICVNDEHPSKAPSSIEVIVEGIDIYFNDKHLLKVKAPILV